MVLLTSITSSSPQVIDQVWTSLADRIQVADGANLDEMLAAGAAAAGKLPATLPSGNRFSLWTRQTHAVGWIQDYGDPSGHFPRRETTLTTWKGTVTRVDQVWSLDEHLRETTASMSRRDSDPVQPNVWQAILNQTTVLNDKISTLLRINGMMMTTPVPATGNFVFSAFLPDFLSTVTAQNTAIWTDRFIGNEADLFNLPVLLIARKIASDQSNLNCVQVEVNGTGRVSRWYFRADNNKLDHADFADDAHLTASTEAEVGDIFTGNPQLAVPGR